MLYVIPSCPLTLTLPTSYYCVLTIHYFFITTSKYFFFLLMIHFKPWLLLLHIFQIIVSLYAISLSISALACVLPGSSLYFTVIMQIVVLLHMVIEEIIIVSETSDKACLMVSVSLSEGQMQTFLHLQLHSLRNLL